MSLLWCGPGNNHGFALGGNTCRSRWATAQTHYAPALSGVKITTSIYCACNLTSIECGKCNFTTNTVKKPCALLGQLKVFPEGKLASTECWRS